MSDFGVYAAGEAAFITGVSPDTQHDWRRRGFLPATGGKHTRFTVRDLCRLRLMRALVDTGFPIGHAVEQLSDDFLDSLQSQVITHGRKGYDEMLAVVGTIKGETHRYVIWTMNDLAAIEKHVGCPFESFHVIRLAKIAADLIEKGILNHPGLRER
jgi:DNA-binding transcriptional MerR regulator